MEQVTASTLAEPDSAVVGEDSPDNFFLIWCEADHIGSGGEGISFPRGSDRVETNHSTPSYTGHTTGPRKKCCRNSSFRNDQTISTNACSGCRNGAAIVDQQR